MGWRPSLGAWPSDGGSRFRVWAPTAASVDVVLETSDGRVHSQPLEKTDGFWSGVAPAARTGDRYRYRVDGKGPFPDPVSRFQPDGVHGPSQIVDSNLFPWTDADCKGVGLDGLVFYEIHIGTFSDAGTYDGLVARLPQLVDLGVTALELMPLADFPGLRNWGYDGVDLFAPARCYGRPDDLRRLVNEAHRLGLAVFLDVVYNHLGPDGNYLGVYSPYYVSKKHHTDWGDALNFDGKESGPVRAFFIENALHWIHEYHFDGLRLDATHVIMDDGPRHFLAELVQRVHESVTGRRVHLIAEDHRNLALMLQAASAGGWGFDGVWADDFHHQMRRLLAGDHEGYYSDFSGSIADLASTLRQGWFYCGQHSQFSGKPRGTDPSAIPPPRFVHFLQNHDQTGNRALGERLNHQIDLASYRAATALLLGSPATPLLFMGQEWAASTPFQFFTDHNDELGPKVTEGRRKEFRHFSAFSDPEARKLIPDPQALTTFLASRLRWEERDQEPHASILRLYKELLKIRRTEPAMSCSARDHFDISVSGESGLVLMRWTETQCSPHAAREDGLHAEREDRTALLVFVQLKGAGTCGPSVVPAFGENKRHWQLLLSTEDARFCQDPLPPRFAMAEVGPMVHFDRPGAVILKG